MILGTGIDLCEVPRMQTLVQAPAEDFVAHVFLPGEIAYCQTKRHPAEHFAARFAAKEAVVKALADTGGKGSFWLDIEIRNEQDGRPAVTLHGRALEMADALGVRRVLVSLTHTREMAAATVVLEG
jgi:holo-[acyl-carrier protein] synthase